MSSPPGRRARPGSPRARLFLALDPSAEARGRLAQWRDIALAGRDDLRPIADDALHMTLVFLGYRPEKEIPALTHTALDAVRDLPAATLTALSVTPVPKRGPRLFALHLDDDHGRAAAIQAVASEALVAERFYRPERRPFWPHLTFARVKRGRRAAPLELVPPPEPIEGQRVTLYRSLLSPSGARYEVLAAIELTA